MEESISAYRQAHDLMWDTRSIIVRFRRQRGNTCLPGEPKPNLKKVKEEPGTPSQVKKEQSLNSMQQNQTKLPTGRLNHVESLPMNNIVQDKGKQVSQSGVLDPSPSSEPSSTVSTPSVASVNATVQLQQQPWVFRFLIKKCVPI